MATKSCSTFSNDGNYFVYCTPDGKLKIWDTISNALKQEYTPNLHLSEPFTCVCWVSSSPSDSKDDDSKSSSAKKKKRISETNENRSDLLALGSKSGNIILYCAASGTCVGQLKNGHSKAVNGFSYSSERNSLFSCSDDKHVIEWKVNERSIKSKWKAGSRALTSVLDLKDGESVLVASSTISWWDVDNKEILKTFTGHATSVFHLEYIPPDKNGKPYFLSASSQENIVNAWLLDYDSPDGNSCATFSLKDLPEKLCIGCPTEDEPYSKLAVVTTSGLLHIFQHKINGIRPKPLKPSLTVDIQADGEPVPILNAQFDNEGMALIAHGSTYNQITFEKIPSKSNSSVVHLIRKERKGSQSDSAATKVRIPEEADGKYLLAVQSGSTPGSKSKKQNADKNQTLPMEQRLNNLALWGTKSTPGSAKPPVAEHSAQLLLQGLHSKDRDILHSVFLNRDEKLIRNTIMRMPVTAVIPLVRELNQLIQRKGLLAQAGVHWLRVVLLVHGAHLLASGSEELTPLLGLVESRLPLLPHLQRLRGRLGLLLEREGLRGQGATLAEPIQEATLVHCDESSDEDSMVNDIRAYSSDSEDNWEEASEEEDEVDSMGKDSDLDDKDIEEEGDG